MQPLRGIAAGYERVRADYQSVQQFVSSLEAATPPGAMVLQLPFTIYLNDSGRARMHAYDHFKPYLVSRHLRWSYPALTNRQLRWQEGAGQLGLDELAGFAAAEGFHAVMIDRYGYADNAAAAVAALLALPEAKTLVEGERYVAVDVSRVPMPLSLTEARLRELRSDSPVTNRLPLCHGAPMLALERVGPRLGLPASTVDLSTTDELAIQGWAVAPVTNQPGADVELEIQGQVRPAIYGFDRPDVAAYLKTPEAQPSGFRAVIPGDVLHTGSAAVRVRVVAPDQTCFYEASTVTLRIN
jgi:hypothetical protein